VNNLLSKYSKDKTPEVAETCMLALERIQWLQNGCSRQGEEMSIYNSVGMLLVFSS
jgi:hypothetical protein